MTRELTREVCSDAQDVRVTNRIGEVAAAPAHGIASGASVIDSSRRLRLGFADEGAHGRIGRAPNQKMNVVREYRLGHNPHPGSLARSTDRFCDDGNVSGT